MRPKPLPFALSLAVIAAATTLPRESSAGAATAEVIGIEYDIARVTPPLNPTDMTSDEGLLEVCRYVQRLINADVDLTDVAEVKHWLGRVFEEITVETEAKYYWHYNPETDILTWVCIDGFHYIIDESTETNPVEFVVTVTIDLLP